jgi:hypothetical protein
MPLYIILRSLTLMVYVGGGCGGGNSGKLYGYQLFLKPHFNALIQAVTVAVAVDVVAVDVEEVDVEGEDVEEDEAFIFST